MVDLALVAVLSSAFLASGGERNEPAAAPAAATPAPEFLLESASGERVSLCAQRAGHVAVAVVFLDQSCPVARLYAPLVGKLAKEYGEQGIRFLVVDCTARVDSKRAAAFAKENGIEAPLLLDPFCAGARRLGVTKSATALLFDPEMKELYRGAIDDRWTLKEKRDHASKDLLVEAIEATLEKRAPDVATSEAGGSDIKAPAAAGLTFNEHVAPILHQRCAECHRKGQVGPMELLDYDDAKGWAPQIAEVV